MSIINSKVGISVKIWKPDLVNIFDSVIGNGCNIGAFVEIGGAVIGEYCSIAAHSFICAGVTIGNNVFIGPGVVFTNDKHPPTPKDRWVPSGAEVGDWASIGAGSIILPGVKIGRNAKIGAGAVVVRDVPDEATWVGVPAQQLRRPNGYNQEVRE